MVEVVNSNAMDDSVDVWARILFPPKISYDSPTASKHCNLTVVKVCAWSNTIRNDIILSPVEFTSEEGRGRASNTFASVAEEPFAWASASTCADTMLEN